MPVPKSAAERTKKINQKEKEVRALRREDVKPGWKTNRIHIWDATTRLLIAVVMLVCFIIHGTAGQLKSEDKNQIAVDRGLVPMTLGGDMLLQLGFFVACIARTFVHPGVMLLVDCAIIILLIIVICMTLPKADFTVATVGVLVAFELIAIILHCFMLFRETKRLKRIKKARKEQGSTIRQVKYSRSFTSHEPTYREKDESVRHSPSLTSQSSTGSKAQKKNKKTVSIASKPNVQRPITPTKKDQNSPIESGSPSKTSPKRSPQSIPKKTSETSIASRKENASKISQEKAHEKAPEKAHGKPHGKPPEKAPEGASVASTTKQKAPEMTSRPNASKNSTSQSRPRVSRVPAPRSVAQGSRR